jgi:hypothetical protein
VSLLHVVRDPADPRCMPVIRAQAAAGVALGVLYLDAPAAAPEVDAPVYVVGEKAPAGTEAVDWDRAVALMFDADTVVTW